MHSATIFPFSYASTCSSQPSWSNCGAFASSLGAISHFGLFAISPLGMDGLGTSPGYQNLAECIAHLLIHQMDHSQDVSTTRHSTAVGQGGGHSCDSDQRAYHSWAIDPGRECSLWMGPLRDHHMSGLPNASRGSTPTRGDI